MGADLKYKQINKSINKHIYIYIYIYVLLGFRVQGLGFRRLASRVSRLSLSLFSSIYPSIHPSIRPQCLIHDMSMNTRITICSHAQGHNMCVIHCHQCMVHEMRSVKCMRACCRPCTRIIFDTSPEMTSYKTTSHYTIP